MDINPVAALFIGAMTWTAISFLKHLKAGNNGDALTLAVVVGVGIGIAFLLQAADVAFAEDRWAKVVLAGYAGTSALRVPYEFKKAISNDESSAEPKLFKNTPNG